MITGIDIGIYEIFMFFLISYHIKKKSKHLDTINTVAYYWIMMTILTGIWEFSFITNYKNVNLISTNFIETKTHVWTTKYDLSYILPWKLAYIFYAEYGA